MGYRILVVSVALALVAGCAAFDKDNSPVDEGVRIMPQGDVSAGLYNGYYSGSLKVESNSCASFSAEVGSEQELAIEIVDNSQIVNVIFEDGSALAGTLHGNKTTVMAEEPGVKRVYYLEFADAQIEGTEEVIEADEAGQFGEPCAKMSFTLAKGEKPAEEEQ